MFNVIHRNTGKIVASFAEEKNAIEYVDNLNNGTAFGMFFIEPDDAPVQEKSVNELTREWLTLERARDIAADKMDKNAWTLNMDETNNMLVKSANRIKEIRAELDRRIP